MKKYLTLATFVTGVFLLWNCSGPKKTASENVSVVTEPPKPSVTYEANLKEVISANCSPCHIPSKGGNKKPYDVFVNVQTDIDEMIRRIELNPTDRGFMPFKKANKLSDSTINVFKQWKADGMVQN